jgi:hypothetical protein
MRDIQGAGARRCEQEKGGGAFAPPPFIHEESVLPADLGYGYGSVEPASMMVWRPFGNVAGTQLSE